MTFQIKLMKFTNFRISNFITITLLGAVLFGGVHLLLKAQTQKYSYQSFDGNTYDLFMWEGKHTVLLTQEKSFHTEVIKEILSITDSAFHLMRHINGREPDSRTNPDKVIIAVVDQTCGKACGALGYKGIELSSRKFQRVYTQMRDRQKFDTILFYELGRNFWFFENQLHVRTGNSFYQAIRKGYAMFVRHFLVKELNINASGYNSYPYHTHLSTCRSFIRNYFADSSFSLNSIAEADLYFVLTNKYLGAYATEPFGAFFWSSYFLYLYETPHHGIPFLKRLFHSFQEINPSDNDAELVEQFIRSCAQASPHYDFETLTNLLKWAP